MEVPSYLVAKTAHCNY